MVRSRSYIATPPGATIKEQLVDRGMSQKEFSARMDMSEKHISKLINGEVQLTPEMAIRLELVLGIPAKFWNNLEAIYREKILKIKAENSMNMDGELAKSIPYHEMAQNGWISETRDLYEKVVNLRKYFEVVDLSLLGNNQIINITCRRLAVTKKSDLALMAWAQRAKLVARGIETAPIDVKGLTVDLPEIRKMTLQKPSEFSPKLKEVLANRGIALVLLPHLKGSFLQGATFSDGSKIVIGITARGKDADKFWFSLFHEIGHVVLGHVGMPGGTTEEEEREADNWASQRLISQEALNSFVGSGYITKQSVCSFANEVGIAPGIVVGRLQNEGIVNHNMLNDLKEQYEMA